MKEIFNDFQYWLKSLFKKRNKRFKSNIHQQPEDNSKYSKAVIQILTVNTLVFLLLWLFEYTPFYNTISSHFIASTDWNIVYQRPWTIITSGISHENLIHFIFNMYGLIMVIQEMKKILTNRQVWFVYVLSVILGSLSAILYTNLFFDVDVITKASLRGASAGVLALLTIWVMNKPNLKIYLFFVPTTLKWLVYINIIASVAMMVFKVNGGGGAAHIAGVLIAWVYMKLLESGFDIGRILDPIYNVSNIFKKKKIEIQYESKYSSEYEELVRKTLK